MIRRLTGDDVRDLARRFRLQLTDEAIAEFRDLGNELLAVVEEVDEPHAAGEPRPPRDRRDSGPASPEEDPLNAITRWIDVAAPAALGPLAGRRIAVKDSIPIAGMPMTCGSHLLKDFVPAEDSAVTARLLAAGARLVAVTTMDDLAFSGGGDTGARGPVRNPFDPSRTSGGSSGGSAACLWYEEIDAAVGTDQGGSIRVPAAWCGVVGLKPTHGLVPYTGIPGIDQTIDHAGPLARTVADAAELLAVLAGPDPGDPRQPAGTVPQDYVAAVAEAAAAGGDLRGLTFGLVRQAISDDVGADPLVVKAVHATADEMRRRGAEVVPVDLPAHLTAGGIAYATFLEGTPPLLRSGGNGYQWRGRYSPDLAAAVQRGLRESADALSPQIKITLMVGSYLQERYGGAVYARAQNLRPALTAAYDSALSTVDALLLPTTPGLPFPLDPPPSPGDNVRRGWALLANTTPTDLTGHPAISLPLAEAAGLPVGVMLVGRRFADAELLSTAARCEAALGRRPLTGPDIPRTPRAPRTN
ncbi:amidase family protein [Actinomadura chibensis]|uniref:Amidase n=1 Tax=Actinomadura chibensis TaxID=392828 RepID=A0A5D0N6P5_9ACTN|nr:amidase family protein [Actinomadura chibensis]TYB40122.1 amidase [Actinomadura chibensis]